VILKTVTEIDEVLEEVKEKYMDVPFEHQSPTAQFAQFAQ
jgi:hypothetical protein